MLLTPAFRNMDATLEEASLVSGAGVVRTLRKIVVPLMTPIVGVVLLLGIVHSLQAFELELILGFPFRFYVFSTQIYWLLTQQPPQFAAATALGSTILFLMVPLIALQRWGSPGATSHTVGGRYKGAQAELEKMAMADFSFSLAVALVITVIPLLFLSLASFMARFGYFNVSKPWTAAALEPCHRGFGVSRITEKHLGAGRRHGNAIGRAVHTDCVHRHPDEFCRPLRSRHGVLVAFYSTRNHSGFGAAVRCFSARRCCGLCTGPCFF